ncbi:hypothetical protein PYCC9005_005178 [Savitreella phatthalungensis]
MSSVGTGSDFGDPALQERPVRRRTPPDPRRPSNLFPPGRDAIFPKAAALMRAHSDTCPQTVAHRGFNKIYPENSIEALSSALSTDAVRSYAAKAQLSTRPPSSRDAQDELKSQSFIEAAGQASFSTLTSTKAQPNFSPDAYTAADGIELDVRLSRDGQVVISHDASLKRCYGIDKLVGEVDWFGPGGIASLESVREPKTKMPLLEDVLRVVEGEKGKWCMLDVKIDNSVEIIEAVGKVLRRCSPYDTANPKNLTYWADKCVLGLWHTKFLNEAAQHLPGIPISHIGTDLTYARSHWLNDDRVVGFNMQIFTLMNPGARSPPPIPQHLPILSSESTEGQKQRPQYSSQRSWGSWLLPGSGTATDAHADILSRRAAISDGDRFVAECHARGKAVSVWTVNSPDIVHYAHSLGVDVVMTDDPLLIGTRRPYLLNNTTNWSRERFWQGWSIKARVHATRWFIWGISLYRQWKY